MGEIIPLPLRARDPNVASRFQVIGGQPHHATMLNSPPVQVRDIRNVWGMTVEGPPLAVADALPFGDDEPRRPKQLRAKSEATKSAIAKRKPAQRAPK